MTSNPIYNFIKKPILALIAVLLVASIIIYIQSQKADLQTGISNSSIDKEKGSKYQKAPDFAGIQKWINSEPLKMEQLRGNVVLVDFWTYTCINCIRTLPYLKEWDKKYRDMGLVIVGVHSPEFEFEKKYENVLNAVNDYQLKYPIAMDSNHATWSLYQNRYWPSKYLIDIDGYIRDNHIGEGGYADTESLIQSLLKERMERLNKKSGINLSITKPKEAFEVNPYGVGTPEIYFGYQFSRGNFGNPEGIQPEKAIDYKLPASISKNNAYFEGKWKNNADNIELMGDEGEILLIFHAKSLNIVAGSDNSSQALVFLDNEYLNDKNKGSDIIIKENKSIAGIKEFKLYNLASAEKYDDHYIDIKVTGNGFKLYTFTFG